MKWAPLKVFAAVAELHSWQKYDYGRTTVGQ